MCSFANVDATYARIDKEGQKGYLTMSANTAYDLTVAGTKVTYGNKGDILGDGSASYDPDTKTLTLTGDIASTTAEQAINSQLDDLTIKVEGAVNISSTYTAMFLNGNTTITGGGFIRCYGSILCEGDLALDHLGLSFSNNGDASGLKYDALSGDGNALSVICCDISFNTDSEHYPVSNYGYNNGYDNGYDNGYNYGYNYGYDYGYNHCNDNICNFNQKHRHSNYNKRYCYRDDSFNNERYCNRDDSFNNKRDRYRDDCFDNERYRYSDDCFNDKRHRYDRDDCKCYRHGNNCFHNADYCGDINRRAGLYNNRNQAC